MKVAILSMQEVKNYGSFLQAFSLKKTIESLGNTCEFINIIPGEQLGNYKISKFHKIKLLIQRLWGRDFIRRLSSIYIFQTRFSKEFLPYLGVESERNIRHYDVIVIGSDEVFNCAQKTWFGFSRQLFGEGLNADKIITYAASFGATTVDKLQELGIKKIVGRLLGNISVISVRDANSSITVKTLIGKVPVMHLDPVLIFNYDLFMPSNVTLKNYMIVYLKSATKLFSVLLASKRPLITELADKLRLKYPLLPTISPCPTMRLEAIRSIIPISCRRYPKSV